MNVKMNFPQRHSLQPGSLLYSLSLTAHHGLNIFITTLNVCVLTKPHIFIQIKLKVKPIIKYLEKE